MTRLCVEGSEPVRNGAGTLCGALSPSYKHHGHEKAHLGCLHKYKSFDTHWERLWVAVLIKCMWASRRRGLIVIVESKHGSIATPQPLKHVLRNPVWLVGDKDASGSPLHFEGSERGRRDVSQLSGTADKDALASGLLPISTYRKDRAIASLELTECQGQIG